MLLLLDADDHGIAAGRITNDQLAELYQPPRGRWVRANFVSTLDGAATGHNHRAGSINTPADNRVFALQRQLADVILVGAGTARAEGYGPGATPIVAVSQHGHLPETLAGSGGRAILATCAASGRTPDADVWVCGDDQVDLGALIERLDADGFGSILCEGGPHLLSSLLEAGLVDELALTWAPTIVGGDYTRITAGPPLDVDLVPHLLVEEAGTVLGLWRVRR